MTVSSLAPEQQPGPGPLQIGKYLVLSSISLGLRLQRHLNWELKAEIVITITWDATYNPLTKGRVTVSCLHEMVVISQT